MENKNVDNTKELRTVEWFFGYGGNELGLRRVLPSMRPIAFCERDAFVVANMVSKMEKGLLDAVPIWTDVKTFPCDCFKDGVDLFIASYPCQPFSAAGKRGGGEDERHLWPDCRRFIQRARPGAVWLENVEGHVSLGLSTVLADLEEDGYTAAWGIFSASEVGAPHQRKRVFILAYDMGKGCELMDNEQVQSGTEEGRYFRGGSPLEARQQQQQGLERHAGVNALGDLGTGCGEDVAHGADSGRGEDRLSGELWAGMPIQSSSDSGGADKGEGCQVWPARPGCAQYGWEAPRVVAGKSLGDPADEGLSDGGGGEVDEQGEEQESERPDSGCGIVEDSEGVGREVAGDFKGCPPEPPSGGEVEPAVGGVVNGPPAGLDLSRYTGLCDSELAEIREWMVKGTNRTDELRMCGNGVVPDTAERAFRVLYAELLGNK